MNKEKRLHHSTQSPQATATGARQSRNQNTSFSKDTRHQRRYDEPTQMDQTLKEISFALHSTPFLTLLAHDCRLAFIISLLPYQCQCAFSHVLPSSIAITLSSLWPSAQGSMGHSTRHPQKLQDHARRDNQSCSE